MDAADENKQHRVRPAILQGSFFFFFFFLRRDLDIEIGDECPFCPSSMQIWANEEHSGI